MPTAPHEAASWAQSPHTVQPVVLVLLRADVAPLSPADLGAEEGGTAAHEITGGTRVQLPICRAVRAWSSREPPQPPLPPVLRSYRPAVQQRAAGGCTGTGLAPTEGSGSAAVSRGPQDPAGHEGGSVCSRAVLGPGATTGSPHLPVGSQLHEGADGLIGAGPAGQHVAAVVGLEEADEVGTLGLLEGGWLLVAGTPAVLGLSSQCPEATCRASRPRSPPRPCLPAGSAPPAPWVPARRSTTTQPWAVMGMRCRMPGGHPLPRADLLGLPARLLQVQQDDVVLGSHHQPGPVLIQQQRLGARHIPWGQQPLGAVGLQQL